jgi:hypothetical protein
VSLFTEGDRPREYPGLAFAVLRTPENYFSYLMIPTSAHGYHLMIRYVLSSLWMISFARRVLRIELSMAYQHALQSRDM